MGYDAEARLASDPIRVYLVDDHAVLRDGLRALVQAQPDMSVVGEAADGLDAIENAPRVDPSVIVMDVALPRMSGAEATKRLRAVLPKAKIVALSAYSERDTVGRMMTEGASGYVLKHVAGAELLDAIRIVHAGGVYLDPSLASPKEEPPVAPSPETKTPLSQREAEVMRRIAEGHAMKEISASLQVSTRTLETYRARAMEKLGLKSRAEIIQYALRNGWLKS